jgi:DNA-binding CsgD family transcriptional regulator
MSALTLCVSAAQCVCLPMVEDRLDRKPRRVENAGMSTLVGREDALRATNRFLQASPRDPRVLVLEGEAGIGKTAVWLDTVAAAAEGGHLVLDARPAASDAQLAYAGVTDLVGSEFAELRQELPAPQARAVSAALLLEDHDGAVELRAVAMGFVSILAELARVRPVVVAVDDIQWLDPASERVLAFAAPRLPAGVRLLLARRHDASGKGAEQLRDLSPEVAVRVVLGPLSLASLRHLIHERTGWSVPRPLLTRLAATSGGNPLYALEIARALARRPVDPAWGEALPVPATLQELVATRVEALSDGAQEVLLVASALSRPTDTLVVKASGADGAAGLAEARKAEVITQERGRIRFTHPLLAAAVYGGAPPEARRRLHRRLAGVVTDPDERARHLAAGSEEADADVSSELELAAARAASRGAPDAASGLYAAAAKLTPSGAPDDRARRLIGEAAAWNAVGDFVSATTLAEDALALAEAAPLVIAARSLLASVAWFNGDAGSAVAHAEKALEAAGASVAVQGSIHAQLVRFNFSLDLASALDHAERAIGLLDEQRDGAILAHVLVDRVFGGALRGEAVTEGLLARALALERRALAAGVGAPHPMVLLWLHCTDAADAARQRFAMEETWYRVRGEDVWVADRLSHSAVAELHAGDWVSAEQQVEEACTAVEALDLRGPRAMIFEKRALIDAHRGRFERGRETLQGLLAASDRAAQSWWTALSLSTLAFLEFADGAYEAADAALLRMHELAGSVGASDLLFDRSEAFHIEVLLALGKTDRARSTMQQLERREVALPRPWIAAALPRARALLAAADGDLEGALAELVDLEAGAAMLVPFECACGLLVRGRIERRMRKKRAAAESLAHAAELFEQLGSPPFAARAQRELERVGLRRTTAELTPTERQIARLASGGSTNREIAQAAFVSQKTVEANLARVYRKLGIHSRAELGARMAAERVDSEQT